MSAYSSSSSQEMLKALGLRLRQLRQDAGLSGRDLGRLTDWLPSKISKIENGKQTPSQEDLRQWCYHCRVPEQIPDVIASLRAVEGLFIEWRRRERTGLKRGLQSTAPLFERTKRFRAYNSWMIPGVFQTPAYAKHVLSTLANRRGVPDDSDEAMKLRLARQALLRKGDRRFAVVVEESVLYNDLLGADLMREQLLQLHELAALPRVSLGVIPRNADRSAMWPVESFWVYDDKRVNIELVSGWLTITSAPEIRMYVQAFAELSSIALHGQPAREVLRLAMQEY